MTTNSEQFKFSNWTVW